ncbi:HAMP domain protein [Oscillibacter sp. KLE 1728]|nr:HAMP domain protein [Oscillibacter sp. KLE 1728]ERK58665.1 HAMP domain protein [Oscillibacter sp. KLE 1745]
MSSSFFIIFFSLYRSGNIILLILHNCLYVYLSFFRHFFRFFLHNLLFDFVKFLAFYENRSFSLWIFSFSIYRKTLLFYNRRQSHFASKGELKMNVRKKFPAIFQYLPRFTSSLASQLTVIILLISFPTLVFTLFTLRQQSAMTREELVDGSFDSTVQIANQINSELKSYAAISNLFYLDDSLNAALLDYRDGRITATQVRPLIYDISNHYNTGMSGRSFSVLVVAEDGTSFGNALFGSQNFHLNLSQRDWYSTLFATTQTRQLWVKDSYLDSLFSTNGYPNIYLVRKLHDRQDWSDAGTLILMISELEIERIYSNYVSNQQSLFILGRDMQIVSSIDNLQVRSFPEDVQPQLLSYSGSFCPAGLEQVGLITYYTIGSPQWKLVYCHDTASILHPFESRHFQYLVLMAVCLVVSVILTTLVVRHYISPIKTLREQMDEVQKGNLDSHLPITANNEIGQLTAHFNLMQDSINLLMQRLVEESEAKRSAEIKALQSQINPHFLYNTLASLRFMIFSGDKERADNIVVSLIHLMKNALSNSQRFVTIDMELRLLDDYIRIQQYTFAHPFAVEIDVTAEVRRCYTIKLLLQPIVENAIFHGLKPKAANCLLQITGRCGEDCVDLYIRDNGVGFDPGQTAPKTSPISTGIGLSNVNERIQLYFGKHYGAYITSVPGTGTEVHIHLPKLKEEEDCKPYEDSDR